MKPSPRTWKLALAALCTAGAISTAVTARAEDKLLREIVEFNGVMLFLESRVPAMIVGVVRNGEMVVVGFGETSDGSGKVPDGQTRQLSPGPRDAQQRYDAVGGTRPPNAPSRVRLPLVTRLSTQDPCPPR